MPKTVPDSRVIVGGGVLVLLKEGISQKRANFLIFARYLDDSAKQVRVELLKYAEIEG